MAESCILDEVLFYLEEIESTMCHFPISKKIKVGRSEACDIQLLYEWSVQVSFSN